MMPQSRMAIYQSVIAQMEALMAEEQADIQQRQPQRDPEACPNCGAPKEKQIESNTLDGQRKIMCIACRTERTV